MDFLLFHRTSSKYDDIHCKVLINSGSPTRYQLTPKKENIGTLKKMTIGEKDVSKTNKTILLVGETGAGKSTLINILVSYALGVTWEDNVWFEIVDDERKSQSQSQTSDVVVYQIFGFEDRTLPYSLTIIDTPGYGSTTGTEHDIIISQRLFDLFRSEDGVHEINAVGLVLKSTDHRLNDRQSYIFDSMVSLFGKDMEKNVVALITHSNGRPPKNALKALELANVKFAKDKKNQPVYFLFDNCQAEERTDDVEYLEHADKISTKGTREFTQFLEMTVPQKLETTLEVMNERIKLTASIHNLQERVHLIELKQKEIQQTQEALKKHEEDIKRNENFEMEIDEVYKETERISYGMWGLIFFEGATCCTRCEENCHYPGCTMATTPAWCEVMKNGCCTVCTNKCHASAHVKENWKFVAKTRKAKKTLKDVKEKYDKGKTDKERTTFLLKELQEQIENLEADKRKWVQEAYQRVGKLDEIALNVDSLSTFIHLDFLIEKMKETGDKSKVQKLVNMLRRTNEVFRAGKQYAYNVFNKMFKTGKNETMGTAA